LFIIPFVSPLKSLLDRIPLGARYMIASAFAFSLMAACVKASYNQGIPVLEILAFRALISLVISVYMVKRKGIPLFGERKLLLFARGFIGFIALIFVFYGVVYLPLAEATMLQYLHPMFTALIALIFLREKASLSTLLCMVLCFIGLLVIVRPDFVNEYLGFSTGTADLSVFGIWAAILGALGSACAYVIVRKLSKTEDPTVIVMYFPLVALPGTLPFLWNSFVMPTGTTWLLLLAVGVSTQLGQVALTKGMQLEKAARAASYSYLQVVFAIVLGLLIYGETPSLWSLLGACLILAGAYINVRGSSFFLFRKAES